MTAYLLANTKKFFYMEDGYHVKVFVNRNAAETYLMKIGPKELYGLSVKVMPVEVNIQ